VTPRVTKALLLDIGVVFFKSAWEIADEFEDACGLARGTVPGRGPFQAAADPLWQRHLAGEITEREYWLANADQAVAAGAPLHGHPQLMRAMFQHPAVTPERPEGLAVLRAAKTANLVTAMFTNEMMDFQGREWVESRDWFPLFDYVVDASETGIRKPDPAAYDLVLQIVKLPAADCVFIDDNPAYVAAGERAGMQSLWLDVLTPHTAFAEAEQRLGVRTGLW
jgi:putative hydrolase of the HAD superfamily